MNKVAGTKRQEMIPGNPITAPVPESSVGEKLSEVGGGGLRSPIFEANRGFHCRQPEAFWVMPGWNAAVRIIARQGLVADLSSAPPTLAQ